MAFGTLLAASNACAQISCWHVEDEYFYEQANRRERMTIANAELVYVAAEQARLADGIEFQKIDTVQRFLPGSELLVNPFYPDFPKIEPMVAIAATVGQIGYDTFQDAESVRIGYSLTVYGRDGYIFHISRRSDDP